MKILLLDDDRAQLEMLDFALKPAGYRTAMCRETTKALETCMECGHDIVISDLKIPGKGGMEFLKTIKEHRPATRVILVTGFPEMQNLLEAIHYGVDGYLTKPVDFTMLITRIRKLEKDIEREKELHRRLKELEDENARLRKHLQQAQK